MNVLSIDTTGKFCSVAISLTNGIVDSIDSKTALSHSEELAVNVNKILIKYNILAKDLDYIIINIGPGSFTGIRIGVSFVKGLSFSKNIPIVPINGFSLIKSKIHTNEKIFYAGIHSHKNYIYVQKYDSGLTSGNPQLLDLNKCKLEKLYISNFDSSFISKNNIFIDCIVTTKTGLELATAQAAHQFKLYTGLKFPY